MAEKTVRSKRKWLIVLLVSIAQFMIIGYNMTSYALILPVWSETYQWTLTQQGILGGIMSFGAMAVALLAGILYEKMDTKTLFLVGISLATISDFIRSAISTFEIAATAQVVMGVGFGIILAGQVKIVNAWFEKDLIYRVNSFIYGAGAAGFVAGWFITPPAAEALGGAQKIYLIVGILSAIFTITFIFVVPKRTEAEGAMNLEYKVDTASYSLGRRLKEVITSKQVILCMFGELLAGASILAYSTVGPIAFFYAPDIWPGITLFEIGLILSMSSIASSINFIVGPYIFTKLGIRKPAMIVALIVVLVLFTGAFFTGKVWLSCIMIFIAGLGNGIGLTASRTLAMEHRDVAGVKAGLAGGLLSTTQGLGLVLFPMLLTSMISMRGAPFAWVSVYAVGAIGVIFLLFTQDTGPKAEAKRQAKLAAQAAAEGKSAK